jgi:transposase-like protein
MLTGMAGRRYEQTVHDIAGQFGVSSSAVSRHVVAATAQELKKFSERDLKFFDPFAVLIDTVYRGETAFIVALGVSTAGDKLALGFWEGATESSDLCTELLSDIESRNLIIHEDIIFVVDGGKGVQKALKMRFRKNLLLQRCTVHKCRNIESHLPLQYRKGARMRFNRAIGMATYEDAKQGLIAFEKWLQGINESAAKSLREAFDELLTLHNINIPIALRTALRSTNAIESLFSKVRYREKNIRRWRNSNMRQRWLGTVLLHCEKTFNRVRGFKEIKDAIGAIKNFRHDVASKEKVA